MPIPSQAEYEANEARMFQNDLMRIERAPLADRREAARELADLFADRHANGEEILAERVGWLLDGNYGYGAYQAAKRIARNKRLNRVAALSQIALALDWQVPRAAAAAWWRKLPRARQERIDLLIIREIEQHLRDSNDPDGRDRSRRPALRAPTRRASAKRGRRAR